MLDRHSGVAHSEFTMTSSFDDASTDDKAVLGGKGAGLVRMTRNGLNVPAGYVVSTECCRSYLATGSMSVALVDEVLLRLRELEEKTGKTFGGGPTPLLVSVRSGAPVSMPGMMDTVLNLGLNRAAAIALGEATQSTRFMADVLFRFHSMYSEIVLDVLDVPAPTELSDILEPLGSEADPGTAYDAVWRYCQQRLTDSGEEEVPDDPTVQLLRAIEAVFRSWNTRRAITYRDLNSIPHEMGTAVVVQSMVFGNLDNRSGSGVVFSRNPVTGEPGLFGEFLRASQGEDVVAGTRTPDPIAQLEAHLPEAYHDLSATASGLERLYRDILDIEFTVERGVLYLLEVRSAKLTAPAAIRIAADFLAEGTVPESSAMQMLTAAQVRYVQRPGFDPAEVEEARERERLVAVGIGASPGQVSGVLSLDPDRVEALAKTGQRVILARQITSPTDLHGIIAADGIVTATGGATSHAAVVARALGKTCVVGCSEINIDPNQVTLRAGDLLLREGDPISVDGSTGEIFAGALTLTQPAAGHEQLEQLLRVCAVRSGAEVLSRATTVDQVLRARKSGMSGVVTSAVDILATSARFAEVMDSLRTGTDTRSSFTVLEEVLEQQFTPLLAAAEGMEFGVRAIDFLVDETAEMLYSASFAVEHPHLVMPLGSMELIRAHVRGLARAARAAHTDVRIHLAVRNISDPREAHALRMLREELSDADPVRVGIYVTSPRGALAAKELSDQVDLIWVELRLLQAAMFGLPPQHLLPRQPLERYWTRGLLGTNPREAIDPSVDPLLDAVVRAAMQNPDGRIGIRVSGEVSENLVATLYRRGFRRFAVDADEGRPMLLALGKAALQDA